MRLRRPKGSFLFSLAKGERELARSEVADRVVVATNHALLLQGPEDLPERIEWWTVNHVDFDPGEKVLHLDLEDRSLAVPLSEKTFIPEIVRERVMATILTSIRFSAPGEPDAVISLRRRRSDGDDTFVSIVWSGSPSESARARALAQGKALRGQV